MTNRLFFLITLLLSFTSGSAAQDSDPDISGYLSMVKGGQVEQVREELPSLLSKYPNNPTVLYLQGQVTSNGAEAVRIYQSIVDNFPKSEWADDALYKVYQFYYALGLYRTAEIKLNQLKKDYPESEYIQGTSEAEPTGITEEKEPLASEPPPADSEEPRMDVVQGQFALQVGAYSIQVNAEKQKLFFEDLGYPVEVINKVRGLQSLFLVLVGNYTTYDEAKAKEAQIKNTYNIDSFVVSR